MPRLTVRYTLEALLHIAGIHSYIETHSPAAAARIAMRIQGATRHLGDFPESGRVGDVPGTREWVVRGLPYIVVYEIAPEAGELIVLGVYHGAQTRPGQGR
jgi:toxin ParE1/3/4